MDDELKARETTTVILVHFTGDENNKDGQIKKESKHLGLSGSGYHFIIESDGKLLMGRHQSKLGSHYQEFDAFSVGVCVVAERHEMNEKQSIALTLLIDKLQGDYPSIESIKYIYRTKK